MDAWGGVGRPAPDPGRIRRRYLGLGAGRRVLSASWRVFRADGGARSHRFPADGGRRCQPALLLACDLAVGWTVPGGLLTRNSPDTPKEWESRLWDQPARGGALELRTGEPWDSRTVGPVAPWLTPSFPSPKPSGRRRAAEAWGLSLRSLQATPFRPLASEEKELMPETSLVKCALAQTGDVCKPFLSFLRAFGPGQFRPTLPGLTAAGREAP